MLCTKKRHINSILLRAQCLKFCMTLWMLAVSPADGNIPLFTLIPNSSHVLGMSYLTDLSVQRRQSILHVSFKHVFVRRSCVLLTEQFVSGFVCLPWANVKNVFRFGRLCYLGLAESAVD